jgi:PAS domain S-box-containing protein/diguanylate cyclase (GGDEF)-like protein
MLEKATTLSGLVFARKMLEKENMKSIVENSLKSGIARLASIVESAEDAILSKSLDGVIQSWNPAAERLFGYSAEEMIGQNILRLIPIDLQDEETIIINRLKKGETLRHYESVRLRKDGSTVPVSLTVSPIYDSDHKVIGASKILRDISSQVQADIRIRSLLRTSRVLSAINSLIVRVSDEKVLFKRACEIAVEIGQFRIAWIGLCKLDYDATVVVGTSSAADVPVQDVPTSSEPPSCKELVKQALGTHLPAIANEYHFFDPTISGVADASAAPSSIGIFPLLIRDQEVGVIGLHAASADFFDDDEIRLLLELAGDIAFAIDHLHQLSKLDQLSRFDAVTGLPNRSKFIEMLDDRISVSRMGELLAVVVIDLQRFHLFNDSFGRNAGDQLLREVAARCLHFKAESSSIARIGMDQFAVIVFAGLDINGVARTIELRDEQVFGPQFNINGHVCNVAARYGIALYPDDGGDPEMLLRNAESALDRARRGVQRSLFYTPDISAQAIASLELEHSLRRAIEHEEFVLYYQPKVDSKTKKIQCVEALIRWQSPNRGLVPPSDFIPLLEETGMILSVGQWIIQRAAADWHRLRLSFSNPPRIAVNVSAVQLRQPDFATELLQALRLEAQQAEVDIEITESLVMDDVESNIATLRAIRQGGIEIAIDDFGTGYSSLAYLAKLPVQVLKIDRAFVVNISNDADAMALVATMIGLAHSLSMKVVAEGVETYEQAKLLTLLRCDLMQGFFFGKPMPLTELERCLASQQA